jgi:hypothetical protein
VLVVVLVVEELNVVVTVVGVVDKELMPCKTNSPLFVL